MSQPQYPQQPGWNGPQQPGQFQPGWGGPQQPWGPQPPQPPKKRGIGKMIGFGCLGFIAVIVLIGIIGALGSSGGDSRKDTTAQSSTPADTGAAEEGNATSDAATPAEDAKVDSPVKVTAKNTKFTKSILADGSNYTSVLVTVANNSDEAIDINPLYFTVTDADGTKRTAELAADEKQIDTVELAPGENVSGTITVKGKITPKYVTYTKGWFGESIRANVS